MRQRGGSEQPIKGRRASKPKIRKVSTAALSKADLKKQVGVLTRELKEAREQQTATADVLQVINSSTGHVEPVFAAMLKKATQLCEAAFGILWLRDGVQFQAAASHGVPAAYVEIARKPVRPLPTNPLGRLLRGERVIVSADVADEEAYRAGDPVRRALVDLGGARSAIQVALIKDDVLLGSLTVYRQEVRSFSKRQIALLQNFADQAVIAIENARLFEQVQARTRDLEESLQQQTATADVLKVISSSLNDLKPVFETIGQRAEKLCNAEISAISVLNDDQIHMVSIHGTTEEGVEAIRRAYPMGRDGETLTARAIRYATVCHVPDVLSDPLYQAKDAARTSKYRAGLAVPMIREGEVIGAIFVARQQPGPFTDAQVQLLKTFADQAVIAIENARLFEELRDRQAELARSVDELTATGDVLKIMSRSSVELQTVLDTLVETVARLCRADQAYMWRGREDVYQLLASCGLSEEGKAHFLAHPPKVDRGSVSGRAALERRPVHVPDVLKDPEYTYVDGQKMARFRTVLAVPLLREQKLLGVFSLNRNEADPFTDKEIELVTTFADQAVIAIENARLFEELRDRQAELRVTFDNMGDGVVMFGPDTRLVAWNRNFQEILDLPDDFLAERPSYSEYFRYLAHRGEYSADLEAELSRLNEDPWRELRLERTRPDGRIIELRRNPVPGGGFVLIYGDITKRKQAEEAIRAARDAAERALRDLQAAQASLVHAQKMAALGQLTAGIAHEIKNPLNFVNNFAALSAELTDELSDALKPVALAGKVREEVEELTGTLKDNLGRVVQHGKRADSIVKNMLLHSREGSGEHRPVEINAVVDESLNLAYHGTRAEKQGFNITLERDFDPAVGAADIYPQEITRVLLNLISNGFYAATQRAAAAGNGFEPKLKAVTRSLGNKIEIRIRDNGAGIPPDIQEKIFNPFFTTKPAGEGTGLGLSMSHDIVVQHGGTIEVATEPGSFTEFIIRLPRAMPAQAEAEGQRS